MPPAQRAAELLERVEKEGDAGAFDHRYVASLNGGSAGLFVGTTDDVAVGYFCDPNRGAAWLLGSIEFGSVQLVAKNGAGFVGGVVSRRLEGTLSSTPSNAGDVTMVEDAEAHLARHGRSARGTTELTALLGEEAGGSVTAGAGTGRGTWSC